MGEAAQGNERYRATLEKMGIQTTDDVATAMEKLGRYVVATNGEASAMADIFDVLGTRSGLRLINTLKAVGTEGLQTIIDKGREANQIMGGELVQALAAANHEIEMWGRTSTVIFGRILGGLRAFIMDLNPLAKMWRRALDSPQFVVEHLGAARKMKREDARLPELSVVVLVQWVLGADLFEVGVRVAHARPSFFGGYPANSVSNLGIKRCAVS